MKAITVVIMATVFVAVMVGFCLPPVFAGVLLDAKADGDDVLVPAMVVKAIPGFDPTKPVYAANDRNGWFVRGPERVPAEILEASKMTLEPDGSYRAAGMRSKRFQVVQLKDDKYDKNTPNWANLENFIPADWIKVGEPKKGDIAIFVP